MATRRPWLATAAAVTSLAASAGAIGLMTGTLTLGDDLNDRLPFASPVLAGLALAVIVATPFALLTRAAWRDDPRTDLGSVAAGLLLGGWIVVQLGFLRAVSFFQPLYLAVGLAFAWMGARHATALRAGHGHGLPRLPVTPDVVLPVRRHDDEAHAA